MTKTKSPSEPAMTLESLKAEVAELRSIVDGLLLLVCGNEVSLEDDEYPELARFDVPKQERL